MSFPSCDSDIIVIRVGGMTEQKGKVVAGGRPWPRGRPQHNEEMAVNHSANGFSTCGCCLPRSAPPPSPCPPPGAGTKTPTSNNNTEDTSSDGSDLFRRLAREGHAHWRCQSQHGGGGGSIKHPVAHLPPCFSSECFQL